MSHFSPWCLSWEDPVAFCWKALSYLGNFYKVLHWNCHPCVYKCATGQQRVIFFTSQSGLFSHTVRKTLGRRSRLRSSRAKLLRSSQVDRESWQRLITMNNKWLTGSLYKELLRSRRTLAVFSLSVWSAVRTGWLTPTDSSSSASAVCIQSRPFKQLKWQGNKYTHTPTRLICYEHSYIKMCFLPLWSCSLSLIKVWTPALSEKW